MLSFSDGFAALLGLAGKPLRMPLDQWREMIHPDDRAALDAVAEKAMAEIGSFSTEFRVITPARSVRWMRCQAQVSGQAGTAQTDQRSNDRHYAGEGNAAAAGAGARSRRHGQSSQERSSWPI